MPARADSGARRYQHSGRSRVVKADRGRREIGGVAKVNDTALERRVEEVHDAAGELCSGEGHFAAGERHALEVVAVEDGAAESKRHPCQGLSGSRSRVAVTAMMVRRNSSLSAIARCSAWSASSAGRGV